MTTIDRLRWYSKAVHYGRHMRHAERLRQSPRFGELLRRVRSETC